MDALALIGNIVGAALVATAQVEIQLIGYCFFCVGCGASIWLIVKSEASESLRSVLIVNSYFMLANIYGIINRV